VIAVPESPDTHYATLGLDPRATRDQVEKAYRFCLEMYGDGALATYSLLAAEDVRAARARIADAYEVLADPERRREYDLSRGLGLPSPVRPFPSAAPSAPRATLARLPDPPAPAPVPRGAASPSLPDVIAGADLKKIRESRGVSLRGIALVTKIGVRFLEYIEEDRLTLLPAPVYLRGFLMEYARALGLDPLRTAESYMARLGAPGLIRRSGPDQ
jgi:flagellar biosynthesis protein FlhG